MILFLSQESESSYKSAIWNTDLERIYEAFHSVVLDTIEFHRLGLYCVHWKNALFAVCFFSAHCLLIWLRTEWLGTRDYLIRKPQFIKRNQFSFPSSSLSHAEPQRPHYHKQCAFYKRCSLLKVVLACYIPACDGVTVGVAQMWRWSMYCSCCLSHSSPWCPLLGRSDVVGIGCAYWVFDQIVVLGKCHGTTQPSCATCSVILALLKESWNTKGENTLLPLAEISGPQPWRWDCSSPVSHGALQGLWPYVVQLWVCFRVGR